MAPLYVLGLSSLAGQGIALTSKHCILDCFVQYYITLLVLPLYFGLHELLLVVPELPKQCFGAQGPLTVVLS